MPDTTATGWPYPLGTDRVMDGDDAIHAVAAAADARVGFGICSGVVLLPAPSGLNVVVNMPILFPAGMFSTPPVVLANAQGQNPQVVFASVGPGSITAAGCTLYAVRISGGLNDIWVSWFAQVVTPAHAQDGSHTE